MSLSSTARGTASGASAGGSLTITPASNFAAGSYAVLVIAYDNSGGGGADPYSSISDTPGNTWTARHTTLRDPSTASSGCVLRLFSTPMNAATLTTSHTITVSAGSAAAYAAALWQITPDTGYSASFSSWTGAGGASTSPSTTSATITVGNLCIGAVAYEYGEAPASSDTDTTNGTWSTRQNANAGSTTSGMSVCTQTKLQTTVDSTQTYNPTYTNSSDWAAGGIQVVQYGGSSPSYPIIGGGYYPAR